jgi:hypothetical protein
MESEVGRGMSEVERTSDPSPLERLASEGEARRVQAAALQAANERKDAIRQRREVRRLGTSNLLVALADVPLGRRLPLLGWSLGAVTVFIVLWLGTQALGGPRLLERVGLAGTLIVPFLYFPARRLWGIYQLSRERAWLRSLPFPVRGYFSTLCDTPAEETTVHVRFSLHDEGPGEDILCGLAGRAGGAVRLTSRATGWEVESGVIWSPAGEETGPTNGPMLAWMRGFITETLLPLHSEHRVTSVRFRS